METYRQALESHQRLMDRMEFSRGLLGRVRSAAARHMTCARPELCVYAAGSLGRLETGQVSDLDAFLFADRSARTQGARSLTRLEEIQALSAIVQINEELTLPPLTGDGRYFKIHEVSDLLAGTGSPDDDSENLFTTRLLLLLESKCVSNDDLYIDATKRIVNMYFRDGKGRKGFRPLFLLNDILRYWRTVCLNYERTRSERGNVLQGATQTNPVHITLRGPYVEPPDPNHLSALGERLRGHGVRIQGAGAFSTRTGFAVFLRAESTAFRDLWWKPDFSSPADRMQPHLTLFESTSREAAEEVLAFLKSARVSILTYSVQLSVYTSKQTTLFGTTPVHSKMVGPPLQRDLIAIDSTVLPSARALGKAIANRTGHKAKTTLS
jgi:hypothetical protein